MVKMTYLGDYQRRDCHHFQVGGASGFLEWYWVAAVEIFACDGCGRPVSFDSYASHCRILTEDGICPNVLSISNIIHIHSNTMQYNILRRE